MSEVIRLGTNQRSALMEAIMRRQEEERPIHSGTQLGIEMLAMGIDAWSKNTLMKQEAAQEQLSASAAGEQAFRPQPYTANPFVQPPDQAATEERYNQLLQNDPEQAQLVAEALFDRQNVAATTEKKRRLEVRERQRQEAVEEKVRKDTLAAEVIAEGVERDRILEERIGILRDANPRMGESELKRIAQEQLADLRDIRTTPQGISAVVSEASATVEQIQPTPPPVDISNYQPDPEKPFNGLIKQGINPTDAAGLSGALQGLTNTLFDAVGFDVPFKENLAAVDALDKIGSITTVTMLEPLPGRPAETFRQELKETFAFEPNQVLKGNAKAITKLSGTLRLISSERARLKRDILDQSQLFDQDILQKTRINTSQLDQLILAYENLLRATRGPTGSLEDYIR